MSLKYRSATAGKRYNESADAFSFALATGGASALGGGGGGQLEDRPRIPHTGVPQEEEEEEEDRVERLVAHRMPVRSKSVALRN